MGLKDSRNDGSDWENRIDFDRLRRERLAKAKALLASPRWALCSVST